ncbi:Nucleolar protein 12 [Cladobotryum mycophilum]|uniref:Nucleolar protein 12 n=1 Tax=Cladobotryum mycophilum TaxID=491253 RepID=A0ABR0SEG3_9HYPO
MAKRGNPLVVSSKAIDPTLNALFAASAGPVTAPPKSRYSALDQKTLPKKINGQDEKEEEGDDEVLSEISEELDYGDEDDSDASEKDQDDEDEHEDDDEDAMSVTKEEDQVEDTAATEAAEAAVESGKKKERKRKRKDDNEDLEGKYLAELVKKENDSEPTGKRRKGDEEEDEDVEEKGEKSDEEEKPPVHESLTQDDKKIEVEKASRTVFLANVSSEAISSKTAKKTLMQHLASVLDKDASPPEKIESLRFRSVAFAAGGMPKRAAYITKSLMEATTKSTNAYAVFSTTTAVRKVVTGLNGTEVLNRHLRVDSVAHPSPMDNRRCVFVGNLGFVDDETVLNRTADGDMVEKKRNKIPSDIEEGLWKTFSTQGKVENVRVVRDPKTRVGKGFAYVQFYDGNDVEAALLLNGKKAKDPRKTAQAMEKARARADAAAGGASRSTKAAGRRRKSQQTLWPIRGREAEEGDWASRDGEKSNGVKSPEAIIFEGRRASSRDALPKDLKGKKGKSKGSKMAKPKGRGARRASAWKSKK